MRAITLTRPGLLEAIELDGPSELEPGEALVRIHRIGICGTDLHAFRGRQPFFDYPRILGHELGVEIVALNGESSGLRVGSRCAVEPYLTCGRCIACRRGRTNCCVSLQCLGVHVDGGMREFIKVPERKLHSSETLSLEKLALVETLGIGAHAVERAQLQAGEDVLVIGAGPIGLSVIQFAVLAGAKVRVMDVNKDRLEFCEKHFNVSEVLVADEPGTQAFMQRELPTAIFDATGNAASMMQSFNMIAHGGKLIFVGLFQGDITFNDPQFHRREMTILSSRNALGSDFRRIIALLEKDVIDTRPWITHTAELSEVPIQFAGWLLPENRVIKAMVSVN